MTSLENDTNVIDAGSQVEEGDCQELEECIRNILKEKWKESTRRLWNSFVW